MDAPRFDNTDIDWYMRMPTILFWLTSKLKCNLNYTRKRMPLRNHPSHEMGRYVYWNKIIPCLPARFKSGKKQRHYHPEYIIKFQEHYYP